MGNDGHNLTSNSPLYEILTHPSIVNEGKINKAYFLGIGLFWTKGSTSQKTQIFLNYLCHLGYGVIYQCQFEEVVRALVTLAVVIIPVIHSFKYFSNNTSESQQKIRHYVVDIGNQIFIPENAMAKKGLKESILKKFKFLFNHIKLKQNFDNKVIPPVIIPDCKQPS